MGTEHNQLNQILDSVTEPHIRHFDMSGVKQVEMDLKREMLVSVRSCVWMPAVICVTGR